MPITKYPKSREPLWKEWDYKADKKGVHSTVYSVNGNQYTGDWDKNLKNGKSKEHWISLSMNEKTGEISFHITHRTFASAAKVPIYTTGQVFVLKQ